MERITEAAALAAVKSPSHERETLTTLQRRPDESTLPAKREPDLATEADVSRAVHEVMLSKQLSLPREMLALLVADLVKLRPTFARLQDMAETVKRKTTYGTIALEHWLEGQLLTQDELAAERRQMYATLENERREFAWTVEAEIRRRIKSLKDEAVVDPLILELVAAQDAAREADERRADHLKRELERARLRLKKAGATIRLMDETGRRALYEEAIQRGIFQRDETIYSHLFMFADKLLPIMQDLKLV